MLTTNELKVRIASRGLRLMAENLNQIGEEPLTVKQKALLAEVLDTLRFVQNNLVL